MGFYREKTCCFTGHRIISGEERRALRERIRGAAEALAARGVDTFISGGALGFDTIAAQEVLRLKDEGFAHLRLVMALPCRGQEKAWNRGDIAVYRGLVRSADEALFLEEEYSAGCMQRRNRFMVDNSGFCVCFLREAARGGTAYTVRYAGTSGLEVINLRDLPGLFQLSAEPVDDTLLKP